MRIDSHQHFWKFDPVRDSWINDTMTSIRRDFLPKDLAPLFEANNIDGCIAVQADQSEKETEFLLQLASENEFIKGVVGWVDLCNPDVGQQLKSYSNNDYFKGVRHILQAEEADFMLSAEFQRGISCLTELNLSYDLLIFPHQIPSTIRLVEVNPEQRFIVDHLAKPPIKSGEIIAWKKDITALAAHKNVYCKLSGMLTEADWNSWKPEDFRPYFDVVLEAFGVERLVYGSDWPVCLLAGTYDQALAVIETYLEALPTEARQAIMGGNAARFYNLYTDTAAAWI